MQKEKEKIVKNHPKMLHYLMLVGLKIVFIYCKCVFYSKFAILKGLNNSFDNKIQS